jgi:pimeloyl-ACP methyl ester carboxylesterase
MDFPRPPKWKRVLRRCALISTAVIFVAAATGFCVQRWHDANIPAPAGAYADLGGRRVHYCLSGAGKYTFILEAGLGDYSASWRGFDASLAALGKTFVYDRAGLGWSDAGPSPRSIEQIVDDLHRTLEFAAIPKPYILVGHSLGGLMQLRYATRFPDEVAGLLLIDPSHPRQFQVLPPPPAAGMFLMTTVVKLAPLGIPQLLMPGSDYVRRQAKHMLTSGAELRSFLEHPDPWQGTRIDVHHTPVFVLTSGALPQFPGKSDDDLAKIHQAMYDLHEDILAASQSSIRRHEVVAGSTHYIHYTNPEVVVGAAQELMSRVEKGE